MFKNSGLNRIFYTLRDQQRFTSVCSSSVEAMDFDWWLVRIFGFHFHRTYDA